MSYSVSDTPGVFVDHGALYDMTACVSQPGTRAALVGFGEYAKHLINLHPDNIVAVYDPETWKTGIKFRGVPVIGMPDKVDINLIIVCEYPLVYEYLGQLVSLYGNVQHHIPGQIDGKITNEIDVFSQEKIYQNLFRDSANAPLSMMNPEKLKFLIEILRLGLTFDGDIVEMGSWQGGSTWYMAKVLALLGETRRIFAMDLFETHSIDPTATMCSDEIERKLTSAYPNCELITGLIDDEAGLARIPGKICFAHIDLGPIPGALEFVWDRLSVGAPLVLDNYGHILAPTWDFDAFFQAKGTRVTRLPWSEQGLVLKR
jgi:predicted O-methyltransferase YrrM